MNKDCSILKLLAVALILTVVPFSVHAYSVDEIIAQINSLKAQIQKIGTNVQNRALQTFAGFSSDLYYGISSNDQVKKLQQFLIKNRYLEEGFDTGNYLSKTVQAIKDFQKDHQLPQTGYFGPLTRTVVNDELIKLKGQIQVNNVISSRVPVVTQTQSSQYKILPKPKYDLFTLEKLVFEEINKEREKAGIKKLVWDDKLAGVARSHSQEQTLDNLNTTRSSLTCSYPFIRHEGFNSGFKVGDRINNMNIDYILAGENIIIFPLSKNLVYRTSESASKCLSFDLSEAPDKETIEEAKIRVAKEIQNRTNALRNLKTVRWINIEWKDILSAAKEAAVDWMNSPGHKRNILTPDYEKTGIGAATVNDYIIITQVFMTPPGKDDF